MVQLLRLFGKFLVGPRVLDAETEIIFNKLYLFFRNLTLQIVSRFRASQTSICCEIIVKLFVYIFLTCYEIVCLHFFKSRRAGKFKFCFLKKGVLGCPCIIVYQGHAIVIHYLLWVVLLKLVDVFVGACRFLVVRLFYSASCVGFQLGLRVFLSRD